MQFLKDYYKLVKHHLDERLPKKIPSFPSVNELRSRAEQEFINSYGLYPTCAVFAPGCFTIAGKSANLPESKSLSMVGANSGISAAVHCEPQFLVCTIAEYALSYNRDVRKKQQRCATTRAFVFVYLPLK